MSKWIKTEELENYGEVTTDELQEALRKSVLQVKNNMPAFAEQFPGANSEDDFYTPGENTDWTTGFWSGEVWLAYENAGNAQEKELFLNAGEKQIHSFLDRIERKHDVDHHDMGFLYIHPW